MMTIGIDVGGSTTKIVGVENGEIRSPQCITAADPVTSLFGALGKYIYDNGISLDDIGQVMLTGVGSAYITSPLYGLPTAKVDEFMANAAGAGLYRLRFHIPDRREYRTALGAALSYRPGHGPDERKWIQML